MWQGQQHTTAQSLYCVNQCSSLARSMSIKWWMNDWYRSHVPLDQILIEQYLACGGQIPLEWFYHPEIPPHLPPHTRGMGGLLQRQLEEMGCLNMGCCVPSALTRNGLFRGQVSDTKERFQLSQAFIRVDHRIWFCWPISREPWNGRHKTQAELKWFPICTNHSRCLVSRILALWSHPPLGFCSTFKL